MSAWRLQNASQSTMQTLADRLHSWLVSNNAPYATSVSRGQTLRWATPYQLKDANGNVIDTNWQVNIKDRCFSGLTAPEQAAAILIG